MTETEANRQDKAVDKKLLQTLITLISSPRLPDDEQFEQYLADDPDFQKLRSLILDLRELSLALRCGDLQLFVKGKGFILGNLKSLQSNLRHMTWQAKKIAKGDLSQKVDFLGEFSEAFNEMTANLESMNLQLYKLTRRDSLTKLYNRMALDQFLKDSFVRAREQETVLSVLMLDIDHFKKVNDNYGHHAGDQVLIKISELLKDNFGTSDMLARYGGEEFIVVQPETSAKQAAEIGNHALESIRNAMISIDDERCLKVTVSAGVSSILPTDKSFEDIVKRSDAALYVAKNGGRDRLCVL